MMGSPQRQHNGEIVALLESAMIDAALAKVETARDVLTIDMHVSFMQAATGTLVATAKTVGGGKSVCFCEATLVGGDGAICSQATGTFRYVK